MNAKSWAEQEFGSLELGHQSRTKRAVKIAEQMIRHPEKSIPQMFGLWGAIKAAYRFFSSSFLSPSQLVVGAIQQTLHRSEQEKVLLVVQDTTTVSFNEHQKKKGFGPTNEKKNSLGLHLHSAIGVSGTSKKVLGLLGQKMWVRDTKKKKKTETTVERKKRTRESQKWMEVQSEVRTQVEAQEAGSLPERPRIVVVADREADIFETLEDFLSHEEGFVIRVTHDRRVLDQSQQPTSLHQVKAGMRFAGTAELQIPAQAGRPARTAIVQLGSQLVELIPPVSVVHKKSPLSVNYLILQEDTPGVKDPICWQLYTTEPAETAAQIEEVIAYYKARWRIEEFHMGLKTGLRCEERQLQTRRGIENFLAMASVIACVFIGLRDQTKKEETALPLTFLCEEEVKILQVLDKTLPSIPTEKQSLHAIAKLGGFIGRASDGDPGWRTLWRGVQRIWEAQELLSQLKDFHFG